MFTLTRLKHLTITTLLSFAYTPGIFAQGNVNVQPDDLGDDVYAHPVIEMEATSPGKPSSSKPWGTGSPRPGSVAAAAPPVPMCPTLLCDAPGQSGDPAFLLGSQPLSTWCLGPLDEGHCPRPQPAATPSSAGASPDPAHLAQEAVQRLRLPLPAPRHSPDLLLRDGRSATVVGEHTWFWTDRDDWRPQHERVQAGAVWAEVTAVPVRLSMSPGGGQPMESCPGPGTPYDRSFAVHAPSPDCDVIYMRSSVDQPGEQVTAEVSITWQVTWQGWTGSSPAGGELPAMTSRAQSRFAVVEAQALRTH
ncbi:hypothetical protein [Saccharopolyspora sp. NPDC003762]